MTRLLCIVSYELGGVATGRNCASPLDDDAVAVDDLRLRLRSKQVAASEVDLKLLAWGELPGTTKVIVPALGLPALPVCSFALALGGAADLVAVRRHKLYSALGADAGL